MPEAEDEDSPGEEKMLTEQRERLRFLRDEGLEFLSCYRSLILPEDKDAVWRLLMRAKMADNR